ncbi:MAG: hypothetical protein IJ871_07565 [Ruminococcus sp.]|nr:hypothetical protein [Ruminococcus sp.]MBR2304982.1 hypothetical protein [Ruminococcus sp.]
MIKGINKQIVEIKCTNNEYFDRALLFVSSDKAASQVSGKRLTEEAEKFCGLMSQNQTRHKGRKAILLGAAAAAVLAAVLFIAL